MDIAQIQLEARDIFLNHDPSDAIKLIKVLRAEPDLDGSMKMLLTQMQFIRIASFTPDQLLALLEKNLLVAYTIPEYSLAEKVEDYVDQVESMAEQISVARKIKIAIQDNELVFSESEITVKGQSIPGTIKNWIADYNSYPIIEGTRKGALDEIEYTNQSSNAKHLTDVQLGVLRDILNLYDYLTNMIAAWDAVPVPATEEEAAKGFDLYNYIPGLEDALEEERAAKSHAPVLPKPMDVSPSSTPSRQVLQSRPVAPPTPLPSPDQLSHAKVQYNFPTPKTTEEQQRIIDQIRHSHVQGSFNDSKVITDAPDNAIIHETIKKSAAVKRGVTLDQTNVEIDEEQKRIKQERLKQAEQIQSKLSDLRKRNQKK